MPNLILDRMSWTEVKENLKNIKIALIPAGSSEQHGPHLPMQVDTACATVVAGAVGELVFPKALVTTPIPIGVSYHHMKFPGTLTVDEDTMMGIVYNVCWSLKQHGISNALIVNGHKGNTNSLMIATRKITDELGVKSLSVDYWEYFPKEKKDMLGDKIVPGHGSEFETSIVMYHDEQLVRKGFHRTFKPDKSFTDEYFRPRTYLGMKKLFESSEDGLTLGDPSGASKSKGEALVKIIASEIANLATREFNL
ncbi:MAG: creatininase family protein [Thaumarchaeota archaeon]|nr:creatininase family protein [Nitrososphaerota archaeon]